MPLANLRPKDKTIVDQNGRLKLEWDAYFSRLEAKLSELVDGLASASDYSLLASGSVTNAATLDIALTSFTGYRAIQVLLSGFLPVTDAVDLHLRFSTDGGTTFDATGYNYVLVWTDSDGAGTPNLSRSSGTQNQINVTSNNASYRVGNLANEGLNGDFLFQNLTSSAFWPRVTFNNSWVAATVATADGVFSTGGGMREAAQDTNAIRFLFSSGNIASGNYAVYGLS